MRTYLHTRGIDGGMSTNLCGEYARYLINLMNFLVPQLGNRQHFSVNFKRSVTVLICYIIFLNDF